MLPLFGKSLSKTAEDGLIDHSEPENIIRTMMEYGDIFMLTTQHLTSASLNIKKLFIIYRSLLNQRELEKTIPVGKHKLLFIMI